MYINIIIFNQDYFIKFTIKFVHKYKYFLHLLEIYTGTSSYSYMYIHKNERKKETIIKNWKIIEK